MLSSDVVGSNALPDLPNDLEKIVAIDMVSRRVYVTQDDYLNPLFQTWLHRCRVANINIECIHENAADISAMRDKGYRTTKSVDLDLEELTEAKRILELGARYGASDIHLNAKGGFTELQFEIDGDLRHVEFVKVERTDRLIRAFYQGLCGTKEGWFQAMECQDAQIPDTNLPVGYSLESARVVRGPAYPVSKGGGFLTVRLQYSQVRVKSADDNLPPLSYPSRPEGIFPYGLELGVKNGLTLTQIEKLDRVLSYPNGATFVTGPTGSGKTQLIYELLKQMAREWPWRRQIWVEDPNELPGPWAPQLYVAGTRNEEDNGRAYSEMGRTALRMAPKILFFGELRGASVALAFLRGCQSGHNGLTTVHTNDPYQAVERIENLDPEILGREKFVDTETTRAYMGVRLIPVLCDKCKVSLASAKNKIKPRVLRDLETWGDLSNVFVRGDGCKECHGAGTKGRRLILEIVLNDEQLARDFVKHGVAVARRNYRQRREDACSSLLSSAVNLVLAGEADPRTIEEKVAPMCTKAMDEGVAVASQGKAERRRKKSRKAVIVRRTIPRTRLLPVLPVVARSIHVA